MSNEKWVQTVIWMVIFLNLVVLCRVFIIPRAGFIADHFQESRALLRESSGPLDMPNQYRQTYRMMNQIQAIANEKAVLLFPPDDWEFGSSRSVVIQMLYPREAYFSGDPGFDGKLSQALMSKNVYVVFNEKWGVGLCQGRVVKSLDAPSFGICQIGKGE